jgi:hypothetical protein
MASARIKSFGWAVDSRGSLTAAADNSPVPGKAPARPIAAPPFRKSFLVMLPMIHIPFAILKTKQKETRRSGFLILI